MALTGRILWTTEVLDILKTIFRTHFSVHCCFYFISPYGHGLKPLDIDFMKQLSNKVKLENWHANIDQRVHKMRWEGGVR